MESRKPSWFTTVIPLIISIVVFTTGVVLDLDARSIQSRIGDIVDTVKCINADQKIQDEHIFQNTEDIALIKQAMGGKSNAVRP
jgi:hypothetical protein